jgi:hypothetical protein
MVLTMLNKITGGSSFGKKTGWVASIFRGNHAAPSLTKAHKKCGQITVG